MFALFSRPVWVALGLLSVGCASGAGSTAREPRSVGYTGATLPSSVAERQPRSARSATHELERAAFVRAVLANNLSLEAARNGLRAALAKARGAGAFDDPMVELGAAPLSVGSSRARFGYEVSLSQRLPWFGKRGLETTAALAEAEATKSDFEAVKRELALTAITLYDQYFVVVRSLEINQAHAELLQSLERSAVAGFAAGRGSAGDALQAQGELARLERESLLLASQRDVTVAQMNELLHRAPEAPLAPPPTELALPHVASSDEPAEALAQAIAARPEIVAARQRARAEQARADRAEREHYPDVTVSASYNSMWDMPEHRFMVGLGFNLPVQTGRRAAAEDEATAMRAQFESDAARLSARARTQLYVARKNLGESRRVLELFERRLLPIAKDQAETARAGFVTSRSPFMAVIEAERNLRTVELDYQMARAECDRRYAELERELGRIPGLSDQGKAR